MCPSDGLSQAYPAWTNYAGNEGSTPYSVGGNGVFAFSPTTGDPLNIGFNDAIDGSGTTAAMAEWLVGLFPLGLLRSGVRSWTYTASTASSRPCAATPTSLRCR